MKTASTHKRWLEKHGRWVHLTHRDVLRKNRPARAKASRPATAPATVLPVDCSGNGACSWPMDANDTLGICGPAMCDHVDGTRTFGQGKAGFSEIAANLGTLESQYEKVSGGDNGTDEDMLVGSSGIWMTGLAGNTTAVVADHLDVDVTDAPLTQYLIDQFYCVCMAWSVPDDFLQNFAQGSSWLSAAMPDANNGHFTPITDVDANGNYRLITWGSWCWVGPAFVASVDPQCFVTFSALQFNAQGYDSHGRHVTDQAAAWVAVGGSASLVGAVVAKFPPKVAPSPPIPGPPATITLANAQSWAAAGIQQQGHDLLSSVDAIAAASAGLAAGWPQS